MQDTQLLGMALGVLPPWFVESSNFDACAKRLDIHLNFPRGSKFICPECGEEECSAYDTEEQKWRHLNFFQHEAYLHARVPRVSCKKCGIKRITVPWARSGSGFTLLFEALVMTMVKAMPVMAVGRIVGEHDTRLWRIIHHYVDEARAKADYSKVTRIAFDETSSRRGHNYISLFVDLDNHRVLFATDGKDAQTVKRFADDLKAHGGDPEAITEACIDMSPAFIAGVEKNLPNASVTFDKFHVIKLLNEAVDEVRRSEQKTNQELKNTRYIWLKNPVNLTKKQQTTLDNISSTHLKTAHAYQIKLTFQDFYNEPADQAETFLKQWYYWATHSQLPPMIEAAKTIKAHWNGILRWFQSRITNGIMEGINSLVQAAKAKARGYRTTRNLKAIAYLIAGGLNIQLPT